jgi:RHS repeat-associated protein
VKQKTLWTAPNPQVVDYTYNARGWLSTINGGVLTGDDRYALGLTYENGAYQISPSWPAGYYNGNISSYTLKYGGGNPTDMTQSYAYDGIDRLSGESYPPASGVETRTYSYNKNGCLQKVSKLVNGQWYDYNYHYYTNTNKVSALDGYQNGITYDASGSVTAYTSRSVYMTYNYHEELQHMLASTGPHSDYVDYYYDNEGTRIAKVFSYWYSYSCVPPEIEGVSIQPNEDSLSGAGDSLLIPEDSVFGEADSLGTDMQMSALSGGGGTICWSMAIAKTGYYFFDNNMLCDYTSSTPASLIGNYVYANGERVARFKNTQGDVRYYLLDHLGSVVATVDNTNALKNTTEYLPWGTVNRSAISDAEKFDYTGQVKDGELALYLLYYGARYYDPKLRVFLAPDPRWDKMPSVGFYVYAVTFPRFRGQLVKTWCQSLELDRAV